MIIAPLDDTLATIVQLSRAAEKPVWRRIYWSREPVRRDWDRILSDGGGLRVNSEKDAAL